MLKAVLYGAIGVSAVSVATHSSGGSGPSFPEKLSSELMKMPAGPFLVGAVGLAVIGYGGTLVWKGFSDKHAKHLATEGKSGRRAGPTCSSARSATSARASRSA